MAHQLIRKLEHFVSFSAEERRALADIMMHHARWVEARQDIISEGDDPKVVNVVLAGWAYRYKQLENGQRQIVAFFVPGDMCDLNIFLLRRMDHCVAALTPVLLAELSRDVLDTLTHRHPSILQALWLDTLVASAIQREWIVNLGQRPAAERIGHLLCELFMRMRAAGLVDDDACEFPPTQADLASATGLSAVHVNRALQSLRCASLIVLRGRMLRIPDLDALQAATQFNPDYLHQDQRGIPRTSRGEQPDDAGTRAEPARP